MNFLQTSSDIKIETYFHPIISLKDRTIVAFEALSRFKTPLDTTFKSISELMSIIRKESELLDLDLLLIETAAKNFKKNSVCEKNTMLFINISSVIVNKGEEGVFLITQILHNYNIKPQRVVLEILEENLKDTQKCNRFFISARRSKYLLALDDVGVGFSNLQRIAQVKPDIIKLDKSLISNMDMDFYKRKVFKSLTKLANDIGSIVVAEGVETSNETLTSLQLGAVLVQGFFFCKPNPSINDIYSLCESKIIKSSSELKSRVDSKNRRIQQMIQNHNNCIDGLSQILENAVISRFNSVLEKFIAINNDIDCIFVLDNSGIQITDTITMDKESSEKHFLFQPAQIGTDHSLKQYYIDPTSIHSSHITERYISKASGKSCRTYSKQFYHRGKILILCIDFIDSTNFICNVDENIKNYKII